MKWMVFSLLFLLSTTLFAAPMQSLPQLQKDPDENLQQVYNYVIAPMSHANWVYLGFAPRAVDPSRTNIYISKAGYTLRVTLEMTEQEVAAYPQSLISRAQRISDTLSRNNLSLAQPQLAQQRYFDTITKVQQKSEATYKNGLTWLKTFYPRNVFEVKNGGAIKVVAHFVYPITTSRFASQKPYDGTYTTNYLEERRTHHTDLETGVSDHIFGGFPAFWFNGHIGIHGPIRYSNKGDRDRSGRPVQQLWAENEIGNFGYNKMDGLNPNYRWDLIRTKGSQGCIRSEPMEIRQLLPASPHQAKGVQIYVMSTWDQVTLPGSAAPVFVNVDYYIRDHYAPALSQEQWLQQEAPHMLAQQKQMMNFPYLDVSVYEFFNSSRGPDTGSMTLLNQAE